MKKEVKGIIVLLFAVIGLMVMCFVKSIPGLLIYLAGMIYAVLTLKEEPDFELNKPIEYAKANLKKENFTKETFLTKGIFVLSVAILPVVLVIFYYCLFYAEPARVIDKAYQDALDELDSLYDQW